MWLAIVLLTLAMAVSSDPPTSVRDLTFLTRDDCVNTPDMMISTDDALSALHWPHDFQVVNIGKLPRTDVRTGYPTPTLLWKGKDIFAMPAPKPPYDTPS